MWDNLKLKVFGWSGQFIDPEVASEFLEAITEVTGGVTSYRNPSLTHVRTAIDMDAVDLDELNRVIDQYDELTTTGLIRVDAQRHELELIVPEQNNSGDVLFYPNHWHDLKLALQSRLGEVTETGAEGYCRYGGKLYRDDNRALLIRGCQLPTADVISIVRDKVLLREDCDQHCLYLSRYGRATLIYRNDAEQVQLREAA